YPAKTAKKMKEYLPAMRIRIFVNLGHGELLAAFRSDMLRRFGISCYRKINRRMPFKPNHEILHPYRNRENAPISNR
ncbi:MAG TPA: hypothetical protein PKJ88_04805, partial [Flexilinea sp.]|nr:hypothetical protein [Flexilinea sp.]